MLQSLFWAVVAFGLLGFLLMLGVGRSTNSLMPGKFNSPDDLLEEGLFAIAFMIVMLPLYPVYLAIVVVWKWFHPPVVLPVEGDDPVWGRNVNRKLVEESFRAVQGAWMQRDADSVKELLGPDLYADLKSDCERLVEQHEINTRKDIVIKEIDVQNERIADHKFSDGVHAIDYIFEATIRGTMTNFTATEGDGAVTAGSTTPCVFEEQLQFDRKPDPDGRWWLVTLSGVPHAKHTRKSATPRKRKPRAKAADTVAS